MKHSTKPPLIKPLCTLFLATAASLLIGCGNDSAIDDVSPPLPQPSSLSGVVFDAPLANATVNIYRYDGRRRGTLLATTHTDEKGDYSVELQQRLKNLYIEAGFAGAYFDDPVSNTRIELAEDEYLSAVLPYESGKAITTHLTFWTHVAACYTHYLVANGRELEAARFDANNTISTFVDVNIINVRPAEINLAEHSSTLFTDELKYGFSVSAISQLMADYSIENGQTPHQVYTPMYFANVACNDIESDGFLDGQGRLAGSNASGSLAIGSVPITANTYRNALAQATLKLVQNDRVNQSGMTVDHVYLNADRMATTTAAIFGADAEKVQSVDIVPPVVVAQTPANTQMAGQQTLKFSVTDVTAGVSTVQFQLDNNELIDGDIDDPGFSINTTDYADGDHTLRVHVADKASPPNTDVFEIVYQFINAKPVVNITSPTLVGSVDYTATGNYEETGAVVTSITVNDQAAFIDSENKTWSVALTLEPGFNDIDVVATDELGNSGSGSIDVGVDLRSPTINPFTTTVRYTNFSGRYTDCDLGELTLVSAELTPICIREENFALNGTSLDSGLESLGYIVLSFVIDDPTGLGVFTPRDELVVEYQYLFNETVVKDWAAVPVPLTINSMNLPVVEEFFGNIFSTTTIDDKHSVLIRVSDNVGNTVQVKWVLRFDTLPTDTTPPTIILTNPTEGAFLKGTINVTANVSDESGVKSSQVWVDNDLYKTAANVTSPNETLDTSAFTDGNHIISMRSADTGDFNDTQSVNVVFDNTAPSVAILNVTNGEIISGTRGLNFTASDAVALSGTDFFFADSVLKRFTPGDSLSYTLDSTAFNDGDHSIALTAQDRAGNAATVSRVIRIDNTAPTVNIVAPADRERITSIFDIVVDTSDATTAVTQLEMSIGNVQYSFSDPAPRVVQSVPLQASIRNGNQTLLVTATDAAGLSAQTSIILNIDRPPPPNPCAPDPRCP